MGITNFIEEAAGAFAADKALEAVDPDAGVLAKAAAAVAGFEGVGKIKEMLSGDGDGSADADTATPDDDAQS
ncbi:MULTISPECIES: hypothetical protein [unclassified Sphingomonas]|uniref:hypothetical protein n=1 Tax=unclassified Sphingomonas TaxID=196159 RepID=UPI000925E4D4|nr:MULTISPECIES: hypothetical protein [unclassified Sphingomonas]MBN8846889.1 hypothetical protein [Sphingomonas sp.]OJV27496.1 MAG: hypothetical protein BGO24_00365 [Sphingomonas sp. 67-36]